MPYRGPRFRGTPERHPVDDFFDAAVASYTLADAIRERNRARNIEDEDRRRRHAREDREERERRATARATDLATPGAMSLSEALELSEQRQASAAGPRMTMGTAGRPMVVPGEQPRPAVTNLNQLANAEQQDVGVSFRRPPPATVEVGDERFTVRDAAPYVTASGVAIDPRSAREQGMQGAAMQAAFEEAIRQKYAPKELQRIEDEERARQRARGEPTSFKERLRLEGARHPSRELSPRFAEPHLRDAMNSVMEMIGARPELDDEGYIIPGSWRLPPGYTNTWIYDAARAFQRGDDLPPKPSGPPSGPRMSSIFEWQGPVERGTGELLRPAERRRIRVNSRQYEALVEEMGEDYVTRHYVRSTR